MYVEKIPAIIKGIAKKLLQHRKYSDKTGGTNSSRYCYATWMRHLVFAHQNGVSCKSGTIAELGPGDSMGIGLTALLTGFDRYYALDVYKYWDADRNLRIFDELVSLLKKRTPIPNDNEFPRLSPSLNNYEFPAHILTSELLNETLSEDRIQSIRNEIMQLDNESFKNKIIQYHIPWNKNAVIEPHSADFIISQAVLQYVDDLDDTYRCMHQWLKPGGYMSHSIDFSSHGLSHSWNGHWTFSNKEWRIAHGNDVILLNREPVSRHLECNQQNNFEIVGRLNYEKFSRLTNKNFYGKFRNLSKEDYKTFVSVIVSRKNTLVSNLLIFLSDTEIFFSKLYEGSCKYGLEKAILMVEEL
jgi:SAM-dependent methyltransferase